MTFATLTATATILLAPAVPGIERLDTPEATGTELLSAMIMVESSGNDRAVGAKGETGSLQISKVLLRDLTRITGRTYPVRDTFNRATSCQIAVTYLTYYVNETRLKRPPTARDYAFVWNRGPNGWKKVGYDPYWAKVQQHLP